MTTNPQWAGHPWATAPHRTVGRRASCQACGQWCYRHDGCSCCNEPAYIWLIEEARDEAQWWRSEALHLTRISAATAHPFPWEAHDG